MSRGVESCTFRSEGGLLPADLLRRIADPAHVYPDFALFWLLAHATRLSPR